MFRRRVRPVPPTAETGDGRSLGAALAAQVAERGDAVALTGDGETWSYAELDRRSRAIAGGLVGRCGTAAVRTATVMSDGPDLISVIVAAAQAGLVVVVVDPAEPPARMRAILAEVDPAIVVVDAQADGSVRSLVPTGAIVVDVDGLASGPSGALPASAGADQLAAIIYTSGSSGGPKGVLATHGSLLHKVQRLRAALGVEPTDRVPLLSPLSGSSGVTLVWLSLLSGATIDCFPVGRRGVRGLGAWLQKHRSTLLVTSASLFRHLLRTLDGQVLGHLRTVVLGGEPVLAADVAEAKRHLSASCRVGALLASTEAGSIALHWADGPPRASGELPAGRPVDGIDVVVMGDLGVPAEPGEVGEIVVTGPHLSPGYWNDPERTASRFGGSGRGRWFRTGDLATRAADGTITLAGRIDFQAKVRGNRIDVAEVEAALADVPGVTAATAVVQTNDRGDARLVAWATTDGRASCSVEQIRAHLRHHLPPAHLPTHVEILGALPVNRQGKVDRLALASRAIERAGAADQAPSSATAAGLAAVWAKALDLDAVPLDRGFFDLGGDSLAAAVVAAAVEARFGVGLDLCDFASSPSVEAMTQRVDQLRDVSSAGRPSLHRLAPGVDAPLSTAQERVWSSCQGPDPSPHQTIALSLELIGPLDVDALRTALGDLVTRHEAMRTTVVDQGAGPVQVVHPPPFVPVGHLDVSADDDPVKAADGHLRRSAFRPFDLETGPLVRFDVVRLGVGEHRLHRVVHHLVSDAWSYRLFLDELVLCYAARVAGSAPVLPPLRFQYRDFAAWERQELTSPRLQAQAAWWSDHLSGRGGRAGTVPCRRTGPPPEPGDDDGLVWWGLDDDASAGIDLVARRSNVTPFAARLAVFALQLAADTRRRDLVIGMAVVNRRLPELQAMVGDFTNLVTLLFDVDPAATIPSWVDQVGAVVADAGANSEVPHAQLAAEQARDGAELPPIGAIFGAIDEPPPMAMGEVTVRSMANVLQLKPQCLTFLVNPHHELDRCQVSFDPFAYDRTKVIDFVAGYQRLAHAIAAATPDATLADLFPGGRPPF